MKADRALAGGGPKSREGWRAPAKINLWLEIVGRRDDGYHLLDTALQTIDLADEVTLEPAASRGVVCRVHGDAARGVPVGEANLAVRAARLLAERTGHEPRVEIAIEKRIPAGAGLGGGSSDAAAVLTALARRFAVPDPARALHDLAAELGADVPFLLKGGTMLGRGVGDELTPIEPPAERWGIVVWPGIRVATAEAYAAWAAGGRPEEEPVVAPGIAAPGSAGGWTDRRNDLEPLVTGLYPEVGRALDVLRDGPAAAARMTGTGSAVFALYASVEERDGDLSRVEEESESFGGDARAWPIQLLEKGVEPSR